jgi:hypothetical protein
MPVSVHLKARMQFCEGAGSLAYRFANERDRYFLVVALLAAPRTIRASPPLRARRNARQRQLPLDGGFRHARAKLRMARRAQPGTPKTLDGSRAQISDPLYFR